MKAVRIHCQPTKRREKNREPQKKKKKKKTLVDSLGLIANQKGAEGGRGDYANRLKTWSGLKTCGNRLDGGRISLKRSWASYSTEEKKGKIQNGKLKMGKNWEKSHPRSKISVSQGGERNSRRFKTKRGGLCQYEMSTSKNAGSMSIEGLA